jgi:hypothetical protein
VLHETATGFVLGLPVTSRIQRVTRCRLAGMGDLAAG